MAGKYAIGEWQPAKSGNALDTRVLLPSGVTKAFAEMTLSDLDSLIAHDTAQIIKLNALGAGS